MIDQKLLKVGEYYRTRDGHKIRLLAHHPEQTYCWIGELLNNNGIWEPETFKGDGNWFRNGEIEHQYDIIAIWKEPLDFDWSAIPEWCDIIEVGSTTGVRWYMSRNGHGGWLPIPEDLYPTNWTEDMGNRFERPEEGGE